MTIFSFVIAVLSVLLYKEYGAWAAMVDGTVSRLAGSPLARGRLMRSRFPRQLTGSGLRFLIMLLNLGACVDV